MKRYVHFRHPELPAQRACGCSLYPPATRTTSRRRTTASGAGLMQDAKTELSSSRFAAGMTRSGAFTWKTHLDARYEGYRLAIKVDPATDVPETVASELASQVVHGLRRAGLVSASRDE